MIVGPAYCVVEGCPAPRIKNDVLCNTHKIRERCHDLDAEAERRIAEHRRPWYRFAWQRTAS